MIIFDLDGTLADCEHRRHFVDPTKNSDLELIPSYDEDTCGCNQIGCLPQKWVYKNVMLMSEPPQRKIWNPDWKSFYEACDQDCLIIPVAEIYDLLWKQNDLYDDFEIWSGRCESVRKKTERWLDKHDICFSSLKMRPKGDSTPDDQLKERWLDESITQGKNIEFVFDDRPKVVRMWRRRGIFVFNCNQSDKEF